MKITLRHIAVFLFFVFTAFALEEIAGPFVQFGQGRWTDSTGVNVGNRNTRINGDLNVTGNYYKNGVLFSGGFGTPIAGSDEGLAIVPEMSGINFAGNTFTATDGGGGLLNVTSTMDTNNYYSRFRLDTSQIAFLGQHAEFSGDVIANSFQTLGTITGDELTVINASDFGGAITANLGIQFADATRVIINSGNDILYKVTTGGAHKFQTAGGTVIAKVDSSNAFSSRIAGMNDLWNGTSLIGQKLIRGVSPTGNSTVTFSHGIPDGKIIGANIWLRHDTTATSAYHTARHWYVHPNSTYDATLTYYAGFDSLYCWARFPATATATRGDSLYFLLTYIQ